MKHSIGRELKLAIYYAIVAKLPNSRFLPASNAIRVAYLTHVLRIMRQHPDNRVQDHVYISDGRNVEIGEDCQINEYVFIEGARIGNHVMIAQRAAIYNMTHNFDRIDIPMNQQGRRVGINPVIEDDVWIGINAVILPGVRIATGCVIGANAVVTHDTKPFGVYGGVPARLIRDRKAAPHPDASGGGAMNQLFNGPLDDEAYATNTNRRRDHESSTCIF